MKTIKKILSFKKVDIIAKFLKSFVFFITLLLMFQFNVDVTTAKEYVNGEELTLVFELPNNLGKYQMKGIYKVGSSGGEWEVTSENNLTKRSGNIEAKTLFASICEGYCSSYGKTGYSEYIVEFFETLAKGNTRTDWEFELTSDLVPNDNKIILKRENNGKITWGQSFTNVKYNEILKTGNPASSRNDDYAKYSGLDKNGKSVNPLNCPSGNSTSTVLEKLQINGVRAENFMTDKKLFTMITECAVLPSICKAVSTLDLDDLLDESSENIKGEDDYEARVLVNDTQLYVVLYNSSNDIVTSFLLGNLTGTDTFNEVRYTNEEVSSVFISKETYYISDGPYCLTHKDAAMSSENIGMYYELGDSGNLETIDKYASILSTSGDKALEEKNRIYVAIRDSVTNDFNIYMASKKYYKSATVKKIITIQDSIISKYVPNSSLTIRSGDWCYKLHSKDEIMAYKASSTNPKKDAFFIDVGNLKYLHLSTSANYANAFAPVKVGEDSTYRIDTPYSAAAPFALIASSTMYNGFYHADTIAEVKEQFNNLLSNDSDKIFVNVVALEVGGLKGESSKNKIEDGDLVYSNIDNGEFPQQIPLNELLMSHKEMRERIKNATYINAVISAALGDDNNDVKENFTRDVLTYGKVIIMFLVFVAILYTAVISIFAGTDINQRTLIKERFKHISIGILIFATALPIFQLILGFAKDSMPELPGIAASYSGSQFYTEAVYEENFILWLIGELVDCMTAGINWLIDVILIKSLYPGKEITIMELVFDVTDAAGNASSLLPFTASEWNVYMYGYRLLSTVAMAIIGISLVKISGEIILASGNYEKIMACKDGYKRIFLVILGIVLAPYGFRTILLLFNYLTGMLPVDASSAQFDLKFEEAGFVGAMANLTFATVRLRIYILFMVRKIMLAFMLISTPVILSLWAVSVKIRSASMWIGETLSNAALQFCYAMVFFVVMLITYEGQNPFVTLILVMLIPKFASFFSDSLQGLAQKWGGISEEKVANDVVNYTVKAKNLAVRGTQKIGMGMQKVSKKLDPEKISKSGQILNNTGNVLANGVGLVNGLPSGNISNLVAGFNGHRSKNEMIENQLSAAYNQAINEEKEASSALDVASMEKEMVIRNNPELEEYCKSLENPGNTEVVMKTGPGYDTINSYIEAKKKKELAKTKRVAKKKRLANYQKQKAENIVNNNNNSIGANFKSFFNNKRKPISDKDFEVEIDDIFKEYLDAMKHKKSPDYAMEKLNQLIERDFSGDESHYEVALSLYNAIALEQFRQTGEYSEQMRGNIHVFGDKVKEDAHKKEEYLRKKYGEVPVVGKEEEKKIGLEILDSVDENQDIKQGKEKNPRSVSEIVLAQSKLGEFHTRASDILQSGRDKLNAKEVAKRIIVMQEDERQTHVEKATSVINPTDSSVQKVTGKTTTQVLHDMPLSVNPNPTATGTGIQTLEVKNMSKALTECTTSIKKYKETDEKLEAAQKELTKLRSVPNKDEVRISQKSREVDQLSGELRKAKESAERDYSKIETKVMSFDQFADLVIEYIKKYEQNEQNEQNNFSSEEAKSTNGKIRKISEISKSQKAHAGTSEVKSIFKRRK